MLIQVARGQFQKSPEFAESTIEAKITLLHVSLTAGTGRRGSEFWKLYSIGFLPENTFTNSWRGRTKKRALDKKVRPTANDAVGETNKWQHFTLQL